MPSLLEKASRVDSLIFQLGGRKQNEIQNSFCAERQVYPPHSEDFLEIPGDVFLCFGESFRFGSKTATGYSQRFSEALAILGLRVEFTKQSVPSPHRVWQ